MRALLRDIMASLARAGVGRVDHGMITAHCSLYPFADLSGFGPHR
jgi:hypothetical protein